VKLTFDGGEQHQNERECAGKRQGEGRAPANASGVTDEHKRKPNRHGRGSDVHEVAKGEDVASERQVPIALAQQTLELSDQERDDQISDEEGRGTVHFARRRMLQHCQKRKQNENGTRIDDLPIEMVPIRLMGAHARGRSS